MKNVACAEPKINNRSCCFLDSKKKRKTFGMICYQTGAAPPPNMKTVYLFICYLPSLQCASAPKCSKPSFDMESLFPFLPLTRMKLFLPPVPLNCRGHFNPHYVNRTYTREKKLVFICPCPHFLFSPGVHWTMTSLAELTGSRPHPDRVLNSLCAGLEVMCDFTRRG